MSTNENMYVTVDDLMHQEVMHLTTHGRPQDGIVFVCQEHGVQPFHAFLHPPVNASAIELGCGCTFFCRAGGELVKVTGPGRTPL